MGVGKWKWGNGGGRWWGSGGGGGCGRGDGGGCGEITVIVLLSLL